MKLMPDEWVPVVSERERDRGTGSGGGVSWAAGCFFYWAETVPLALFRVFISSLLFSFSVFCFSYFLSRNLHNESKSSQTNF
jgi:hypothetical protein